MGSHVAAQRKTKQADAARTVGTRQDRRHHGGNSLGPAIVSLSLVGFAALLCGLRLEHRSIGRGEVVKQIRVDALFRQRVGIALIGAGLEFESAAAVEQEDARALSRSIRSVSGQGDGAFVGINTELFRRSGPGRIAHREQREACYNRSSIDRRHQGSIRLIFCWCRLSVSLSLADNKPLKSLASESGPNRKTPPRGRGRGQRPIRSAGRAGPLDPSPPAPGTRKVLVSLVISRLCLSLQGQIQSRLLRL